MLARASRWSSIRTANSFVTPITQVASDSFSVISAQSRTAVVPSSLHTSKRLLTLSTTRALPRQLPPRPIQEEQHDQASITTAPTKSSNISDELSGTDPSIPWFLQTETIDAPTDPSSEAATAPALDTTSQTHNFSYIPATPKVEEPKAVSELKSHLLTGPSSNLVARPSEEDDQLTPITLIHPASLSKDPSADVYGTNDWIIVVQVKSSAAGSVRRVALDIGRFLKHTRPPALESELDLDDFLGPGPSAPRYQKQTPPKPTTPAALPRPKGMSRIEHELGKSLTDWAVHRIALKKKFPDGWRPPKILSREAQEGIRLLHSSDPEQFDVIELSARFRISSESVRRILRSGKWAVSGEVRSRQDRRAAERAAERENAELAEIRRLQEDQSELVDQGESPAIEEDYAVAAFDEMEEDPTPGIQPVRYEGLVMSASDASSLGVTNRSKAGGKKGDGNWCLVDADWCMVHVMTEQARFNYDIEGIWRELEVGKLTKPKPWEDQSSFANGADAARPSRPRTKRDLFGENLSDRRRGTTNNNAASAGNKFGSSFRSFTTTPRQYFPQTVPESLAQLLQRAQTTFASGTNDSIPVTVTGWLRSTRKQKSITFLELSDGSLLGGRSLQAVVRSSKDSPSSEIDRLAGLTMGTALRLSGTLKPGRGTKVGQAVELDASSIEVLSSCDLSYPLAAVQMQQNSTATEENGYSASLAERRNPHLLGRLPRYAAVARTRQRLESGMVEFLSANDFVKVACPVFTSSDCEGAGEVFQVVADTDVRTKQPLSSFWSGNSAYLTVSSQLHLEAAGLGLGRVWTLNPAFRAEGSATNRHLAEFWMLEAEMYFTDLNGILDVTEGMIKAGIQSALKGRDDMDLLGDTRHLNALEGIIQGQDWKRITYHQAHRLLAEASAGTFQVDPNVDQGLASEHERYLAAKLGPVFVTHYPLSQKAFYMKRAPSPTLPSSLSSSTPLVECFDLLIPNLGELVGGSVREHRPSHLERNLADLACNDHMKHKLEWYLDDLKKFGGSVEHAGFGMGLERLLAWVSNTISVRDVVPFPRVKGPIRF
ncbi:related to Asparaginyl-tRNA synthetase [Melanopsichium pennsylvanicum]|uniref:asparagine--tRNA ligase n=2 Tax=Melanopsichium pennsylvanicum TaxID=63383 RepID=A0AAJ4XR84_9BASI|nr:related to Asparaginyl-tRNA synthetase [Melanopsichium pennsylvanicum 4]SNX87025.1 related to Asparaginyl-tRNA synthetase [Melanopsichium pennsylvanicum]